MGNQEKKPSEGEQSLEVKLQAFRKEIQQIKDEEMAKKAEGRFDYNPAFEIMGDIGYLGQEEYNVYTLFKERNISPEEFTKRHKELMNYYDTTYKNSPKPPQFQTIKAFWAYMGNQMQEIALERLREEKKKEVFEKD